MAYSKFHPGQYSLWMDWETSGADFDKPYEESFKSYQGIQVGLVIADNVTFEEVDTLKINIKFDPSYTWQDTAEKIHGLSREWLEENGVDQEEAAATIIEFIVKYFGDQVIYMESNGVKPFSPKVCIGGHNVGFDIAALQALLNKFDFAVGVHHVKLDTSTMGFMAIGEYKSDKVFAFFGGEKRGDHDALQDAQQALGVARGVRQLINTALAG